MFYNGMQAKLPNLCPRCRCTYYHYYTGLEINLSSTGETLPPSSKVGCHANILKKRAPSFRSANMIASFSSLQSFAPSLTGPLKAPLISASFHTPLPMAFPAAHYLH